MNPVVHFEMPYEDKKRMADFYNKAFGWTTNMLGAEMGDYVVVMTTEADPKTGFPTEPGRINGGFFKQPKNKAFPRPIVGVEDIKAAIQRVKDSGGKVLGGMTGEYDDIPGVGYYSSFIDTEGNQVGMIQPTSGPGKAVGMQ
ncbi:VOC family protein [Candidatus Parcubacteria bacterium]|nr:VOC family protein [Candidatus Parcubacteria bacterium]